MVDAAPGGEEEAPTEGDGAAHGDGGGQTIVFFIVIGPWEIRHVRSLKPWPIPTTVESHYPGSQDTESWIEKRNSLVSLTQYKTYLHRLHNSPIW